MVGEAASSLRRCQMAETANKERLAKGKEIEQKKESGGMSSHTPLWLASVHRVIAINIRRWEVPSRGLTLITEWNGGCDNECNGDEFCAPPVVVICYLL